VKISLKESYLTNGEQRVGLVVVRR